MGKKLKKNQHARRVTGRAAGTIFDCDEISISVFPPPGEHGAPHCHVYSKILKKVRGKERLPEIKIFLEYGEIVIIEEGFSERDLTIIGEIIFNDVPDNEKSNDEILLEVWESLHES